MQIIKRRDFIKSISALSIIPIIPAIPNDAKIVSKPNYEALAKERYFYHGKIGDYTLTWSLLPRYKIAINVKAPKWEAWTRWTDIKGYDWEVGFLVDEVKKHPEKVINDITYRIQQADIEVEQKKIDAQRLLTNEFTHYNGFPIPQDLYLLVESQFGRKYGPFPVAF